MRHLFDFRHDLHRHPDLSGHEDATARRVAAFLAGSCPSQVVRDLGGHGLAFVYDSGEPGPSVMFRAELDALPIAEQGCALHRSTRPGLAHLCGHDGHMAILAGLARDFQAHPPQVGRVILLFQPAEETGAGARAVLADPRFAALQPDWAFALHNMPGLELGHVAVAAGPAACASVGLHLTLHGVEAHAAQPETGRSPLGALDGLLDWLKPLSRPQDGQPVKLATVCHLQMGIAAFGVAPGSAQMHVTLRCETDAALARLEQEFRAYADTLAARDGLALQISRHDHFNAAINHPEAAQVVATAMAKLDMRQGAFSFPMRPSEDFGAFSTSCPTALFFIGAGRACPALHNPDYDFPDDLIAPGVALFRAIFEECILRRATVVPGVTR